MMDARYSEYVLNNDFEAHEMNIITYDNGTLVNMTKLTAFADENIDSNLTEIHIDAGKLAYLV